VSLEAQSHAISLVVCTLGRRLEPLESLLGSLELQVGPSFEVVVVDQSGDDAVEAVVRRHNSGLNIRRIPSAPGLTLGRNLGVISTTAPLVGFPDDDCWYPAGFLASLVSRFDANQVWDAIACVTRDADGRLSLNSYQPDPAVLTIKTIWVAVEPALFVRRSLLEEIGLFNEYMGPGASTPFQAGEGTELLCRGLRSGATIQFEPDLHVHHPQVDDSDSPEALTRALSYGRGIGLVTRRARMPPSSVYRVVIRPLPGTLVALATGDRALARRRWSAFRGRLGGYLARFPGDAPPYPSGTR
jgi:glycosyltransferase involved in cell wall biosynthesis